MIFLSAESMQTAGERRVSVPQKELLTIALEKNKRRKGP
jgi:hypothetical protein